MKSYWPIIALVLFILLEIGIYTGVLFPDLKAGRLRSALVRSVISACAPLADRSGCYDREIPRLMERVSMEEAFAITAEVQREDPAYAYCHVLGHELSVRETRKDPALWMDVVTRCPSGMCSNGCIHGAFQERYRTEVLSRDEIDVLVPDLSRVCLPRDRWQPTGLEQANCFHALGHLLMYISGADTPYAASLCERLTSEEGAAKFRRVCFDGVFMQLYQPLEPEDRELIRGKEVSRGDHEAFCRAWQGSEPWFSCWVEGWTRWLPELQNPQGVALFCSYVPQEEQKKCTTALLYVMAVQMQFDLERTEAYCAGMDEPWREWCYAGMASRLVETDAEGAWRAASWCDRSPEKTRESCYEEIVFSASYMLRAGSGELVRLCRLMPEDWRTLCQNQQPQSSLQ